MQPASEPRSSRDEIIAAARRRNGFSRLPCNASAQPSSFSMPI